MSLPPAPGSTCICGNLDRFVKGLFLDSKRVEPKISVNIELILDVLRSNSASEDLMKEAQRILDGSNMQQIKVTDQIEISKAIFDENTRLLKTVSDQN